MGIFNRFATGLAFAAMLAGAPATAGCWTPPEREAARLRELQTMLMVASLRCHAAGIEITGEYNGFVRAAREAIEVANLRIKTHFAGEGGTQADYDRFTTVLANAYGDGQTDAATCAEAADTARAAAAATADALARLAAARLFPRALPGDGCAPTRDAAPVPATTIAAAATPAPMPAPVVVTLPDEVVAALTVMARYGARPAPAAPASMPTQLAAITR